MTERSPGIDVPASPRDEPDEAPSRPDGVDESSYFDPESGSWPSGEMDSAGRRDALWRIWSRDGTPLSEIEYLEGERHGAYREWLTESESGFEISEACEFCGRYQHGVPSGEWRLVDIHGTPVRGVDLGDAPIEREFSVLRDEVCGADAWRDQASRLFDDGKSGEAMLALARSVATSCEVEVLEEAIDRHRLPATPARARSMLRGAELGDARHLSRAMLLGADPASCLRMIAAKLESKNAPRAALDLINAGLLLEPTRASPLEVRAAILIRLGLNEHAALDIDALARTDARASALLNTYRLLLFPTFDFWPIRETLESTGVNRHQRPQQDLAAIRQTISRYARRFGAIRSALSRHVVPTIEWFPPDVAHLVLPDAGLRVETFVSSMNDVDVSTSLNEQVQVDNDELPTLLRFARAEWNALTYLCWSVGLTQVAMPETIDPPAAFGEAVRLAELGLQRCRGDSTESLPDVSSEPGFGLDNIDIDALPSRLVPLVEEHYVELTAMFRWLSDAEYRSPWQDDVRGV